MLGEIKLDSLRTQKARGLFVLSECEVPIYGLPNDAVPLSYNTFFLPYSFPLLDDKDNFPLFARPCPITPRHGFIDSRLVYNKDELVMLWLQVSLQDPQAEIICMPFFKASWSAVIHNGGLDIGTGNSGATLGVNSVSVSVPQDYVNFRNIFNEAVLKLAHCNKSPYFEIIGNSSETHCVQLRDGPEQHAAQSYIPRTITVEKIIHANIGISFPEWETACKECKDEPNTVVMLAKGMGMGSHYAVQAISHNIPVIPYDEQPGALYGEILYETSRDDSIIIAPKDRELKALAGMIKSYLKKANSHQLTDNGAKTAFCVLHGQTFWNWDERFIRARAYGISAMLWLGYAACKGEMRYWYSEGPGKAHPCGDCEECNTGNSRYCSNMCTPLPAPYRGISTGKHISRGAVHTTVAEEKLDIHYLCRKLRIIRNGFNAERWSGGFGGPAWGNCAKATHILALATGRFMARPNQERYNEVIRAYNAAVNEVHNGACSMLSKWLSNKSDLDIWSQLPQLGLANPVFAGIMLGVKLKKKSKSGTKDKSIKPLRVIF
jgi:hypothetical protein